MYYRGMGGIAAVDVTGFILAGGKSTRMGTDKAFIEFEGHTLLERALSLARSVTPDVRIVGAREKFAPFAPVVEDIFRERGPLGGIHAALRDFKDRTQFYVGRGYAICLQGILAVFDQRSPKFHRGDGDRSPQ